MAANAISSQLELLYYFYRSIIDFSPSFPPRFQPHFGRRGLPTTRGRYHPPRTGKTGRERRKGIPWVLWGVWAATRRRWWRNLSCEKLKRKTGRASPVFIVINPVYCWMGFCKILSFKGEGEAGILFNVSVLVLLRQKW